MRSTVRMNASLYTGSSPIAGLVSRCHVIQVKSDNGKLLYSLEHVITFVYVITCTSGAKVVSSASDVRAIPKA